MAYTDLKLRSFLFAVAIGRLVSKLSQTAANRIYTNQLLRCSSSVGANYRAAKRAKSKADFINKLKIVEEEIDESIYFLELLKEFNPEQKNGIEMLIDEAEQLLKIFVASIVTARSKT